MLRKKPGGNVDPRIAILAAGFQQQHGGLAIGGQPVGQHAAGRTGADDDEVEFLVQATAFPSDCQSGVTMPANWATVPICID